MSLKNKLNRLKPHMQIKQPEDSTGKPTPSSADQEAKGIPYLEKWRESGVSPFYFDGGYCLVREKSYPLTHRHGAYKLGEVANAVSAWGEVDHPLSAKGHQPSDLFFFDTETTGLGGGTGNYIFLLGHARLQGDEIIVKQHVLPSPGQEVPLYQSFLESVDYKTLVTYNGKAFDWPQVKTRHTLVREHVPKLPSFGHFDLLHAARRFWKGSLESVSLSNVEKEILGVERKDDVPGFLAPMIYFDYVRHGNPEALLKVLEHNETDILSLMTLYTHLSFKIQGLEAEQTAEERVLIGKWFDAIGNRKTAAELFASAAAENLPAAKHQLAFQCKREGEIEQAQHLWEEVAVQGELRDRAEAAIELAKLMEHQLKDFEKAITYTEMAVRFRKLIVTEEKRVHDRFLREADKRWERLSLKVSK